MQISFTGTRNTSSIVEKIKDKRNITVRYLNTQLKDDEDGNDLTEYKNLVKKYDSFKNQYYSNFVNIACINNGGTNVFKLNGIIVPETDGYLPVFSFIAKITQKIAQKPEKNFVNDRQYLISPYVDRALLLTRSLSIELNKYPDEYIDAIHNPKSVKLCAQKINKSLENTMMEYFA